VTRWVAVSDEADFLLAFDEQDPEATIEDIAIATRWTLTRVRRIAAGLLERDLVSREGDAWKLTSSGRELRHHYEKGASASMPHPVVDILPGLNLDKELDKALAGLSPQPK